MKKVFFAVLMFMSVSISAQTSITPSIATTDETNLFYFKNGNSAYVDGSTFLILPYDGVQKKDLFHKVLLALNDIYNDVDQVVTKIEYDAITINSKTVLEEPGSMLIKGKSLVLYSILYRLSFKFKDGKIRIDAPSITKIECKFDNNIKKLYDFETFKQEGMINIYMELEMDKVIKRIFKKICSSESNDNW